MQTVVKKWGNSLALRLPQALAADLRLAEGATVSLTLEDQSLVIRPMRRRFQLNDLLAQMHGKPKHAETDWGKPEGKEVW